MKKLLFISMFLFFTKSIFAQSEESSINIDSLALYIYSHSDTNTFKFTYYPISNLGTSSVQTKVKILRTLYNNLPSYSIVFDQYGNTETITEYNLYQFEKALIDLKNDLENIDRIENKYISNSIKVGSKFIVGYYFVKNLPQWYYMLDYEKTLMGSEYWFEFTINEAKEKIATLKKLDVK